MNRIKFRINEVEHSVGSEVSSDLTLLEYLRNSAELRGTKYMCLQGGCGACNVVAVKSPDSLPVSVNACIVSVASCHGWDITTIEKVGNRLIGYHALQKTLAETGGSQCGYCSPGWIMTMYSILQSKKSLSMLEIEKILDSNICRCTGYRSILEAFKKFAKDAPTKCDSIVDIEELKICCNGNKRCKSDSACETDDWCFLSMDEGDSDVISFDMKDGRKWHRVQTTDQVFSILNDVGDDYMLISGNTGREIYPTDYSKTLIDISTISEMKDHQVNDNLIVGAATTLSELLDILKQNSTVKGFEYVQKLNDHISIVRHYAARNLSTVGGELMIKHNHNEYPSDLFVLFETVAAKLTLKSYKDTKEVTMQEFLTTKMNGYIILKVSLPQINQNYQLVTYRIMPRSQNATAIVNAGFLFKLDKGVISEARITYGGLSPSFVRANKTETDLVGKTLLDNNTLKAGISSLNSELIVEENVTATSAEYRKQLAINLFYKCLLTISPETDLGPQYRSGAINIKETRPVSSAKQSYDNFPLLYPLYQPMSKLDSLIQCSGEAMYTEDLTKFPREVYAAFVLSSVALGTISSVDPSRALNEPGVLNFFTAKDIPGLNSFTAEDSPLFSNNEEILCSGEIKHYNQPIGIIVAQSSAVAKRAANMVQVSYTDTKQPVIDISKAKNESDRNKLVKSVDPKQERKYGDNKLIKNSNLIRGQYHYPMENLVCVTIPSEHGLDVYASTQNMDDVQTMISRALKLDENRIDVYSRRIGGGYGLKVSRESQVAVACSLVAYKLNRPCRFIQSLSTTMRATGKRFPCVADFEVEVDGDGKIQYMNYVIYEDNGYKVNELVANSCANIYDHCYDATKWKYKCYNTITDTHKNTWSTSTGSMESIAMTEWIMEQISYKLSVDSLQVRLKNLNLNTSKDLLSMIETLKVDANYKERRTFVDNFNKENRWKKRGLRFSLLRWLPKGSQCLEVNMSVYYFDGSIAITHGGIEMGQGINTKVAQICSHIMKVPLSKIKVKGQTTNIVPNGSFTSESLTAQNIGVAVTRCCYSILDQLNPIKILFPLASWDELVGKALTSNISLQNHGYVNFSDLQDYTVYGVTLAEVEIDVLTGEYEVLRVDILQDAGQSVNPKEDVIQIESAFMMGQGYWTTENLIYDKDTGELLTDRTSNYFVPTPRDIPQDLRVYLRKLSYSKLSMFGAKTSEEPAICMSIAVPFAIREAITAARLDAGIATSEWFQIDGPYTVEKVCLAAATNYDDFKLK